MSLHVNPTESLELRAGPLRLLFEAGDLRCITIGEHELVRRIYAAVRDPNWDTVPGQITDLEIDPEPDRFRIRYTCTHHRGTIHFVWRALIQGDAAGTLRFEFEGEALSTFLRNRIGLCLLHPLRECIGRPCVALDLNGTPREVEFPRVIAQHQPVPGFENLAGLAYDLAPGIRVELAFRGEAFETEDQRNWIDASFKTYGTPLRLPFPVEVEAGTRLSQSVELRLNLTGSIPASVVTAPRDDLARVALTGRSTRLPSLGVAWADHGLDLTEREIRHLAVLRPGHLRVDVRASDPQSAVPLTLACADREFFGGDLELVAHVDDLEGWADAEAFLVALRRQMETAECLPSRVLVLGSRRDRSTPAAVLAAARRAFRGWPVSLGAGTDADLYQLNLQRPPSEADFIAWTMNPQVHAFDLRSIAETPEGARAQVESVRSYFPGKPLCVSAVSLRPRFNPVATGPRSPVEEGELPASVDPRQPSLFAAAWTLAMLAALSEGGLDSATFFETTGWRGVMETASGPLLPDRFPSSPGVVFPLYHVLADVAAFAGADVLETTCHGARDLHALLLRRPGRTRLLLANLAPHPRRTILQVADRIVLARSLEVSTTIEAMSRPAEFRERWLPWAGPTLVVPAYGVVTLDTPPEHGQARA